MGSGTCGCQVVAGGKNGWKHRWCVIGGGVPWTVVGRCLLHSRVGVCVAYTSKYMSVELFDVCVCVCVRVRSVRPHSGESKAFSTNMPAMSDCAAAAAAVLWLSA